MPFAAALAAAAAAAAPAGGSGMPYLKLNTGARMPQMLIGTFRYDNDTVEQEVSNAFDAGFRGVLAAEFYNNQWGVARAVKTQMEKRSLRREDIFIAHMTPGRPFTGGCGNGPDGTPDRSPEACFNQTMKDISLNLEVLGIDYLDLMMLHMPNTGLATGCDAVSCQKDLAQWRAYEEMYRSGKVKAIGVSNYCQGCLECLMNNSDVVPAVNQVQYHIGMGTDPNGLHSFCAKHGIVIQAYSPLATGSLVTYPVAAEFGEEHGKTGPQVALKWVVDQGKAISTEAINTTYLQEDIDMFSWNLTAQQTANLSAVRCPISWEGGQVLEQQCHSSYCCPARNFTGFPGEVA